MKSFNVDNKLRIVLDTNIVISALLSKNSNPGKILDLFLEEKLHLFYSKEILAEYENVLYRPHLKISTTDSYNVLSTIRKFGKEVLPTKSNLPLTDEDDRIFYDAAKHVGAILITGNIKHFPDEDFIQTPAKFVKELTKAEKHPLFVYINK